MKPLILASSSTYRRELLSRLRLHFECASPDIDETPFAGEQARTLAERLAKQKAEALAKRFPDHLIIGSDQVALISDELIGKPGTHERACAQLEAASGKTVSFLTGLTLLNSGTGRIQTGVIPFHVHFRQLDRNTIERYLKAEQPYDCAGSFKAEGLGISLFKRMEGDDPTSLIGLPLIRLVDMLANEGVPIPSN